MAEIVMDDFEFISRRLENAARDIGKVSEAVLYKGAEQMIREWKHAIEENNLIDTGDLINSIGIDPKGIQRRGGVWQVGVGAQGKDRNGVRNGLKAGVLNYGTSSKEGYNYIPGIVKATDTNMRIMTQMILDTFIETGKLPNIDLSLLKAKRRSGRKKG